MDDHPLILKILRQELEYEPDIRVIWENSDASQLTARINRETPHVIVLDLAFTRQSFERVSMVHDLRAQYP